MPEETQTSGNRNARSVSPRILFIGCAFLVAVIVLVCLGRIWLARFDSTADRVWQVTLIDETDLAMCHGWDEDGNEMLWDEVTFVAVCVNNSSTMRLNLGTHMFHGCYSGELPRLPFGVGDRFRFAGKNESTDTITLNDGTVVVLLE
ncbi:MAG: hypothetical protein AAFU85_08500 [Planctomycetota bacterium]